MKQSEVMTFGSQRANLQDNQEEVIALREQLSDSEANTRHLAEHLRTAIEDKKRADKALLRAAAPREELETLRASVVGAQRAAENEKQKVISTLEELQAVKDQLAAARQQAITGSVQEERASRMAAEALVHDYQRFAIQEQRRADDALERAAISLQELEDLKSTIIEARTAEERERRNATSAFEQLEIVKNQLAALAGREPSTPDNTGPLHQDQILPATQVRQAPLLPEAIAPSSDEQRTDVERSERQKKVAGTTDRRRRQATLKIRVRELTRTSDHKVTLLPRGSRRRTEPEVVGAIGWRPEAHSQSVGLVERPSRQTKRQPGLLRQNVHESRSLDALSLPSALRPDSRLW